MAAPPPPAGAGSGQQNVKVAVRLRPFNKRELALKSASVVEVEGGTTVKVADPSAPPDKAEAAERAFTFDHAYGADATQAQVYADVGAPILDAALRGFNATIFAYGQTGSGKTWSMLGGPGPGEEGIIPLLNAALFARVDAAKAAAAAAAAADGDSAAPGGGGAPPPPPPTEYLVTVSFLEIYNEVVKDLLNPSDRTLAIREHPQMGVYVQDLAEIVVASAGDVARLLESGQRVRHVAATQMNERSSRSHSCFTLRVEQRTRAATATKTTVTTLSSKINLVDLAGSERAAKTGATGDVLKQGAAINKSLSALGNVINALAEGKKGHVPYRDSKLTRLLQHSLGGNALTVMVAAVSPADDNYDETLSTLQYANRAKNIKNDAKRNEDVNETLIRQLRDEIEALRRALAAAQAGGGSVGGAGASADGSSSALLLTDEQRCAMEEMIANLERAKQQSWEEKQRLSTLYEGERRRNLENETRVRSVMQTLKEDNMELIGRMRALVAEGARLAKLARQLRRAHKETKLALADADEAYRESLAANGGAALGGPLDADLAGMGARIAELRAQAGAEAGELTRLRRELDANEGAQASARAEAAAQRRLLEEDAELRKAIQEEERAKLEAEADSTMARRLAEERSALLAAAASERCALEAQYAADAGARSAREQQLELALLQVQSEAALLQLDVAAAQEAAAADARRADGEHRARVRAIKREALAMVRQLVEACEGEQAEAAARAVELRACLADAVADIEALRARLAAATAAPAGAAVGLAVIEEG